MPAHNYILTGSFPSVMSQLTKKAALHSRAALAKSSGEEGSLLHGWRSRSPTCGWSRLRLASCGIGHEANVHSAIGCPAFTSLVVFDWLILAQSNEVNLVRGNAVFRAQVLNHCVRPPLAQAVVVVGRPARLGAA